MRKLLILLFTTIGVSQTTFTDEEIINLENDFIYLENKVDSLSYQDSLKALMIETLKLEIDLSNKEIELLQPIEEKATDAINAVAEKGKYTYILDSSSGILLYSKDSENILDKVKKELGL